MPIIREKRQVGSIGPIGVVNSRGGDAERYRRLANATDKLTQLAIGEMGRQAAISGAQKAQEVDIKKITTINPETGKPEALDWINNDRFIGRTSAQAYEEAIAKRFEFSVNNEIKQKASEVALKYKNQPNSHISYEKEMNTYIDGMMRASEQGGKSTAFTNYIYQAGVGYVAATKTNMMEADKAREDAITARAIIGNADDLSEIIKQKAFNGENVSDLITKGNSEILSGTTAGILTEQAPKSYDPKFTSSAAIGVLQRTFEGNHELSVNVTEALITGNPSALTEEERSVWDQATKYMTKTVTVEGTNETYEVIDSEALAIAATYAKGSAQVQENNYNDLIKQNAYINNLATEEIISESIFRGVDAGDVFANEQISVESRKGIFVKEATDSISRLRGFADNPLNDVTDPERKNGEREIKEAYQKTAMITAYNNMKGSPDQLQKIINGAIDSGDTSGLTGVARQAVEAIIELGDGTKGNNEYLDSISNDLKSNDLRTSETYRAERKQYELDTAKDLIKTISMQKSGLAAENEFSRLESLLNQSNFLSGNERSSIRTTALNATADVTLQGYKYLYLGNRKVDSNDLAIAAKYAVDGDASKIAEPLRKLVDTAKERQGTAGFVASKLSELHSRAANLERIQKERNEISTLISTLDSEVAALDNSKENRERLEKLILSNANNDPAFYSSNAVLDSRNAAASIVHKGIRVGLVPPTLSQTFDLLSRGGGNLSEEQAINILSLYANFSNQPSGETTVNMFTVHDSLKSDTIARLEAIYQIHLATGDSIVGIASDRFELDKSDRASMSEAFGGTTEKFVIEAVPDAAQNPSARRMLIPLAEHLYGPKFDAEKIKNTLESFYDKTFKETKGYVIEPNSISGSRSRSALDATLPNREVQSYFINYVNTELLMKGAGVGLSNSNIDNRAFLIPMPTSSTIGDYMVVTYDGGILVPVLNKQDPDNVIPFYFSTAEPDVINFARNIAAIETKTPRTVAEVAELRQQQFHSPELEGVRIGSGQVTDIGIATYQTGKKLYNGARSFIKEILR